MLVPDIFSDGASSSFWIFKELLRIPVGKSVSTENAINAQTPDRQKGLEISNRNFPL